MKTAPTILPKPLIATELETLCKGMGFLAGAALKSFGGRRTRLYGTQASG
jgi:hypothetical protein